MPHSILLNNNFLVCCNIFFYNFYYIYYLSTCKYFQKMVNFSDFLMTNVVRPYLNGGLCMEMILVGQGLTDLFLDIETEYVCTLFARRKEEQVLHQGWKQRPFCHHDILKAELSFFHYKTRVDQVILDCPMRYYTIHALIFIYSETSI